MEGGKKEESWKSSLSGENISSFEGYFRRGTEAGSNLRTSSGYERKFPENELFPVLCFHVSQM